MNTVKELIADAHFCYKMEFVIIINIQIISSLKIVPLIIIFQKLGPTEDFLLI